ncbi:hypothetical protein [Methylotenera sp.]|uniref:hypothetical protein n=1 Tax=Methylotenera sp. TaxID=2051956 RepID=UPI0024881B0E|nr:hypothetical protein [Methylotenera sp.]MDI1298613.1 hypothetical protein [Methylotenera sp.]
MALSVERTIELADEAMQRYNGNVPVNVIVTGETQGEVYGQENSVEKIGRITGTYHAKQGAILIFADNIRDEREVATTIRHEISGHWGINTTEPIEKRHLLERIVASKDESSLKPLWDEVDKLYSNKPLMKRSEEVFAFIAERESVEGLERTKSTEPDILAVSEKLTMSDIRRISESIENGIAEGVRAQKIFPEHDGQQYRLDHSDKAALHVHGIDSLAVHKESIKLDARFSNHTDDELNKAAYWRGVFEKVSLINGSDANFKSFDEKLSDRETARSLYVVEKDTTSISTVDDELSL